jgi:hypothetical protein
VPRSPHTTISAADLDKLIEQATVDCYNDSEQATGLFTLLEEHLAAPFQTIVLGMLATVRTVDITIDDQIVAICQREGHRQTIPILDLPLPTPAPDGWEWIEAYRRWLG